MKFENKGKWMRQIVESAQMNESKTIDDIRLEDIGKCLKAFKSRTKKDIHDFKNYSLIAKEIKNYFKLDEMPSVFQIEEVLDDMPKDYMESTELDSPENEEMALDLEESAQVNEDNPHEKEWDEYRNGVKGSFMKHLANAFQQADMSNLKKLHSAFPEVSKKFWLWKTVGKQEKP